MKKNKKKKRRNTPAPVGPVLSRRIKTTIDFGDEGLPLELLGSVTEVIKGQHRKALERLPLRRRSGFVPISIARYVELHLAANPGTDRQEFTNRLRATVEASKTGTRCQCGEPIWVIGSSEAGMGCFTCITGEACPDGDYEIDEVLAARDS